MVNFFFPLFQLVIVRESWHYVLEVMCNLFCSDFDRSFTSSTTSKVGGVLTSNSRIWILYHICSDILLTNFRLNKLSLQFFVNMLLIDSKNIFIKVVKWMLGRPELSKNRQKYGKIQLRNRVLEVCTIFAVIFCWVNLGWSNFPCSFC